MANEYGSRQWKITSAGVVTTDKVRVNKLSFVPNAASDDLVIVDNSSKDVWRVTDTLGGGLTGAESFTPSKPIDFNGFNVSTLGSNCTLYV